MPGVCVSATQEMHGRSPTVLPQPGPAWPLPGSCQAQAGVGFATGCREPAAFLLRSGAGTESLLLPPGQEGLPKAQERLNSFTHHSPLVF